MKMLIINSVLGYGSTGKIVLDIAHRNEQAGNKVKIAYGRSNGDSEEIIIAKRKYGIRIGNDVDVYIHALYTRLTDRHGFASKRATTKFLRWAEEYNPDVLWIHNIHGYYINVELLFQWIKARPKMQVKWTLHDCWSFTGHCTYFTYVNCNKWRIGCHHCPQLSEYPRSVCDNSKENFDKKKQAFCNAPNLSIITPSSWLKTIVQKGFLSEYPVEVIHNSIDYNVFRPTGSGFKKNHGIEGKTILLGVANKWERRKGLNDFINLSTQLDNDKYQIVLVGLSSRQVRDIKKKAPDIIALPKTSNIEELVQIYSAADVFVNPTYEENYPTVNLEAEACGTRVITYNTGGCGETINRKDSMIIEPGVENILKALNSCIS